MGIGRRWRGVLRSRTATATGSQPFIADVTGLTVLVWEAAFHRVRTALLRYSLQFVMGDRAVIGRKRFAADGESAQACALFKGWANMRWFRCCEYRRACVGDLRGLCGSCVRVGRWQGWCA
jgi:hypothetical protein